jgi:hypothetical protein
MLSPMEVADYIIYAGLGLGVAITIIRVALRPWGVSKGNYIHEYRED